MTQPSHQNPAGSLLDTLQHGIQNAQTAVGNLLDSVGLGTSPGLKRGQTWEREFVGKSGQLTFSLRVKREKSGKLSGFYSVRTKAGPGGNHWPLTGELHPDDSFTLEGTQNRAVFTGSLRGGVPQVKSFKNGSKFAVSNLKFTPTGNATSSGPSATPAAPTAPVNPAPGTAAPTSSSAPAPAPASSPPHASQPSPLPNLPALKEPGFLPRLRQVAARVNTTPEIVLAFLNLESNLNPATGRGSSSQYQGLGQIGKAALTDINNRIIRQKLKLKVLNSTSELNKMSATQQLDYIELHLVLHMHGVGEENRRAGRTSTLEEVYMGHLGGSARYAHREAWARAGSGAYLQNPMDANNDGKITPAEVGDTVRGKFTSSFRQNLDERSRHLKKTVRKFNGKNQTYYVFDPTYDNGLPHFSLDGNQTAPAPVVPQTPPPLSSGASAPTPAPDSVAPGAEPPDQLDQLLKLKAATHEYTFDQIRAARQLIKLQPESARSALYLLLQEKSPYHTQRNNLSVGRPIDGDKPARIGDVMCNLTSAAMVLEQLGIENPDPKHFPQFEDYLEDLRRKFVDAKYTELIGKGYSQKRAYAASYSAFHRTTQAGWGKVLELMGATYATMPPQRDQTFWENQVKPHLAAGSAVMMSINGHIVRLQGMNEQGLIVDDPFSNSNLRKNRGLDPKYKSGKYKFNTSKSGNDTVWTWAEVKDHDMLWIAVVNKR